MKKFNLKKALAGAAVTTRDGHSVLLTGTNIGSRYVLQGVVRYDTSLDRESWTLDGRYMVDEKSDSDLFML